MEKNIENKPKKQFRVSGMMLLLTIVLSSAFGAAFGFMSGGLGNFAISKISPKLFPNSNSNSGSNISKEKIVEEDSAVIDTVQKSTPSVVSIVISKDVPKFRNFDPFGDFFSNPFSSGSLPQNNQNQGTVKQTIGGGSGFFVTDSGMIVTNKHVVEDTQADYTVVTSDGKEYLAKVLARGQSVDVAIIKIEGNNFPVISLGDSDALKAGQTVIAIGNSLGEFSNTISKGIISGLKRNLTAGSGMGQTEQLTNIIQTDAAINPGNSGGPLININGEVIGVNVAMAQGAENIGFAIPINQIKKIITQVEKQGKISTPYLGIRYVPIDKQLQTENNFSFDYGVIVARGQQMTDFAVIPGSPADKAGIVENDVILEINGKKIDSTNTLNTLLAEFNVGDQITLKVWHKGDTKDVSVKLEERKQ
jgi:serine protease Do